VILDAWLTLGVVVTAVAVMATDRAPASYVVMAATTVLLVAGVIDTGQAFQGFSNPAPIAVAALYVVAAGAAKTGLVDRLPALLGSGASGARVQMARLLVPTAVASAFLNNTPIVAMVAPSVLSWAQRTRRSPSKWLMPVSFASILGGLLTLIGTSTNLVVSGLLEASGAAPLGLFEIGLVGLPVAGAGLAFLVLAGPALLPDRRSAVQDVDEDGRKFTVEMLVSAESPLVGQTIDEGGLRHLDGVFLVELERRGRRLTPVTPSELLEAGDRLTFAGNIGRVLDLQRIPGLVSAEERHFPDGGDRVQRRFFEAVIAEGSSLAGSTLKEVGFRARYGAAVVAIRRAGARIALKLGDITLRPGDLLVVLAHEDFQRLARRPRDFIVVAPLGDDPPPRRKKQGLVALVMAGLMVALGTQVLDVVQASLLAAVALVALRVLTPAEARFAVDLNVVVVIGASFGLGAAIAQSGLADQIALVFIRPLAMLGDTTLLLGILIGTMCLTELITNNAAAVLMFPIATAAAAQAGLDPRGFAIAVALGASASFLSPIGYQTNTMVYAMGGYRFTDFTRLGLPLTILVVVVAGLVLPVAWPLR
jgi:di/tricarboxylate transporter